MREKSYENFMIHFAVAVGAGLAPALCLAPTQGDRKGCPYARPNFINHSYILK